MVVDNNNEPIPWAAVGILSNSIGVATTEDGAFSISVFNTNLNDFLKVSGIGFENYKIKVQNFINLEEKNCY